MSDGDCDCNNRNIACFFPKSCSKCGGLGRTYGSREVTSSVAERPASSPVLQVVPKPDTLPQKVAA